MPYPNSPLPWTAPLKFAPPGQTNAGMCVEVTCQDEVLAIAQVRSTASTPLLPDIPDPDPAAFIDFNHTYIQTSTIHGGGMDAYTIVKQVWKTQTTPLPANLAFLLPSFTVI